MGVVWVSGTGLLGSWVTTVVVSTGVGSTTGFMVGVLSILISGWTGATGFWSLVWVLTVG